MSERGECGEAGLPQVAILFSHFAPYHIDRIEAAAGRLEGRARVLGVETAGKSHEYDWEPARGFEAAEHVTLFPGRIYEDIGRLERLTAYAERLRETDLVLVGVPYSEPDIVALAWRRRARGRRIVAMTDSKFDDKPRNLLREQVKARLLAGFSAAMVAGVRQREYLHFLGFADKPLVPGYDTLSLERVRGLAEPANIEWARRPFVYVGRFVAKKNLPALIEGYARYVAQAGDGARHLVLVGEGPERDPIRALVAKLGLADRVEFAGHQDSRGVARELERALALCLVSTEEQWGLVVNEAVALGIPAIVSTPVGARDALVRDGATGRVVDPHSPESIAAAMCFIASDERKWRAMSAAAAERAWLADAERFADGVEALFDPSDELARANVERFWSACEQG